MEECAEFMWQSAACRADKATEVAELTTSEIEDGEGALVQLEHEIEAPQRSQVWGKEAVANAVWMPVQRLNSKLSPRTSMPTSLHLSGPLPHSSKAVAAMATLCKAVHWYLEPDDGRGAGSNFVMVPWRKRRANAVHARLLAANREEIATIGSFEKPVGGTGAPSGVFITNSRHTGQPQT